MGDQHGVSASSLVFANSIQSGPMPVPSSFGVATTIINGSPVILAIPISQSITAAIGGQSLVPTSEATPATVLVTSTPTTTALSTASSAPDAAPSGVSTNTIIAIVVPVAVLLAIVPTLVYLFYRRRRDRREKLEAPARGRPNDNDSGSQDAHLLRRTPSQSSAHKMTPVSTEYEKRPSAEMLEKQPIFSTIAPVSAPQNNAFAHGQQKQQQRSVMASPNLNKASPTLPPLDFGTGISSNSSPAPAPAQKRRPPPPVVVKPRPITPASDEPSWPLPATGLAVAPAVSDKPLPTAKPAASTRGLQQPSLPQSRAQQGSSAKVPNSIAARESSIAYGMPPIPPTPEAMPGRPSHNRSASGTGDGGNRLSSRNKKRDSDAVSELSFRGDSGSQRRSKRDTDAMSMISAMSANDR